MSQPRRRSRFLRTPSLVGRASVLDALRRETVGGALLLLAAVAALIWANSPLDASYQHLRELTMGPDALGLHLSLESWVSDGLLALFFFVAGLELKQEFVFGKLRRLSAAAVPVVAAVSGMAVPALIYLLVTAGDARLARGWAIPTATDVAFALGVLAVVGRFLPAALRVFLLTLAVVDDLGGITLIAVFYPSKLTPLPLLEAAALLALFAFLQSRRLTPWWLCVPLGVAIWALTHASGIHATVAGVAMGLLVRVHRGPDEHHSPCERLGHALRPLSAGVAVPVFALFTAGVSVNGGALGEVFANRAALGVIAALFLGKTLGIFGGAFAVTRLTRAGPDSRPEWADMFGVAVLGGISFTVSLLIGKLAFGADPGLLNDVKAAILIGSLLSAVAGGVLLWFRNQRYKKLHDGAGRDLDQDGITRGNGRTPQPTA